MSFKQAVTLTGISVIVRDVMPNFLRSLTDSICAVLGMSWKCIFIEMVSYFVRSSLLNKIAQCKFLQNMCFEIIYHI